jgi:Cu-Zn family superoxide dismutase
MKAVATFQGALHGSQVHFSQADNSNVVHIKGDMVGLSHVHGMHIHEFGDMKNPGKHFNPFKKKHGSLRDPESHAGDLGNIIGSFQIRTTKISLRVTDANCVIGRCLVIHESEDDLVTQPSGDAGHKLDLAVIGIKKDVARHK